MCEPQPMGAPIIFERHERLMTRHCTVEAARPPQQAPPQPTRDEAASAAVAWEWMGARGVSTSPCSVSSKEGRAQMLCVHAMWQPSHQ